MNVAKPKTPRARAQYLLSPAVIEDVKIRAAKERVQPNRLVERILAEGLKRRPEPAAATA